MRTGKVMCGSDMYFQTFPGAVDTLPRITAVTKPTWLSAALASATTCYTDNEAQLRT